MKIKKFNLRIVGNWQLAVGSIKSLLTLLLLLAVSFTVSAQKERQLVRDGNKLYNEKKFSDAEVKYKKSLEVNKSSVPANYNLGNAFYQQGKFDEATKQYETVSSNKDLNNDQKAKAFHNLGNSMLEAKKYPESIEAYKNSLKINPKDNDTRYNLAYAQSMLQQQQQQQQQNKDNKDQKKDQKNQKKDQKEQKQEQNKDQQKKDQEQQKEAQKKQNISKEDAEKILQALNNDEKNTQKKLMKKEATKIQIDKAW